MNTSALAAIILAASTSLVMAADDKTLSGKVMDDHPGTKTGATANPTAKPAESSGASKQMKDAPGVQSETGTTADPTAKPADSSISSKQMKDAPGVQ